MKLFDSLAVFLLATLAMLTWTRNPDPEITGYRIYWRTFEPTELRLGGPWLFSWDLGKTNRCDFPMVDNLYYDFVVTDYNAWGMESEFSNEIFMIAVRPQGGSF
jgi:hypothetical protein